MNARGRHALLFRIVLAICCAAPAGARAIAAESGSAATACDAAVKAPKLVSTAATVVPESVWVQKRGWEAKLRFRIDAAGVPSMVMADVAGSHEDADLLESITIDTLRHYRFCLPADFSTQTDWRAEVRFVHRTIGSGEMYIQMFAPSYTRGDVAARRSGTAAVEATFGQDGRPSLVHLASSSGDPVLDEKTIDAVSTYQLTFHGDTALMFPRRLVHPIKYEIR